MASDGYQGQARISLGIDDKRESEEVRNLREENAYLHLLHHQINSKAPSLISDFQKDWTGRGYAIPRRLNK